MELNAKETETDEVSKPKTFKKTTRIGSKTAPLETDFNFEDDNNQEYLSTYNYYIYYNSMKPKDPRLLKPTYKPVPDMDFIKEGTKFEKDNNEQVQDLEVEKLLNEEEKVDDMMNQLNIKEDRYYNQDFNEPINEVNEDLTYPNDGNLMNSNKLAAPVIMTEQQNSQLMGMSNQNKGMMNAFAQKKNNIFPQQDLMQNAFDFNQNEDNNKNNMFINPWVGNGNNTMQTNFGMMFPNYMTLNQQRPLVAETENLYQNSYMNNLNSNFMQQQQQNKNFQMGMGGNSQLMGNPFQQFPAQFIYPQMMRMGAQNANQNFGMMNYYANANMRNGNPQQWKNFSQNFPKKQQTNKQTLQRGKNTIKGQNNIPNMTGPNNFFAHSLESATYDEIYQALPEICKDHSGSKIFQKVYEESTEEQKQKIIDKLKPNIFNLSTDLVGNYVIQNLLSIVSPINKKQIITQLYGKIKELTLDMYGCRVIQKVIEVGDLDDIRQHLAELKGDLIKCVQDQNGNHVIQKLIERLPQGEHSEIIKSMKNKVYHLSIHQYGCRAIQRIFEFCTEEEKNVILKEIYERINDLCHDPFGNYVIQNIVERIKDNDKIYKEIKGHIVDYSFHKFASNVVEKCLSLGNKEQVDAIVSEVIEEDNNNREIIPKLVRDKFGNYVVQKILEVGNIQARKILVQKIYNSQVLQKREGYAKHVINTIEKLGLSNTSIQSKPQNNDNMNNIFYK